MENNIAKTGQTGSISSSKEFGSGVDAPRNEAWRMITKKDAPTRQRHNIRKFYNNI